MSNAEYESWLAARSDAMPDSGFEVDESDLNASLKDFQRVAVAWSLRRGRAALFAECGLGKTFMQLEWSRCVVEHTGGRVLILAPLAVSQQTIREGAKFGVSAAYAKSGDEMGDARVVVTNYERLSGFNPSDFAGVVLDESSILKSYMGATKRQIIESFASTPYRLACTATPAPNDHMELGNHADFLGVGITSHEMLARWFINDTSTMGTYRLKGHAVDPFWNWVSSWGICITKPSDLGFSDDGYILPPLTFSKQMVDVDLLQDTNGALFRIPDMNATSVHKEKRKTAPARAARIAELVASEPSEPWLIWCDTDYEADELTSRMPDAVEVRGSHSPELKEKRLLDFVGGESRILITKPRVAGFGLNLQHCARVAFVGATFSYEQFYQCIRRAWRFGQEREVLAYMTLAATEEPIWSILMEKKKEHDVMRDAMSAAMIRGRALGEKKASYKTNRTASLPSWMR
jgi:superfamily II DNA or RNA helicase